MSIVSFFTLCLVSIVLIGFLIGNAFLFFKDATHVHSEYEKESLKSFLFASSAVAERFGSQLEISDPQSYSIHFCTDRREGTDRYNIQGSQGAGTVDVLWLGTHDPGIEFTVIKLFLVQPEGEKEILWENE